MDVLNQLGMNAAELKPGFVQHLNVELQVVSVREAPPER
jgi:hypothetical protein